MFGFLFDFITMISLMINSFLGCWERFICFMATSRPVDRSMAMYTVPEALLGGVVCNGVKVEVVGVARCRGLLGEFHLFQWKGI